MTNKKLLIDVLKNLNDPKKVKKAADVPVAPQMKKGGSKFSSDLNATNRLFKKNSLFKKNPLNKPNALFKKKKVKSKTYSPTAPGSSFPMSFDNGGIVQIDGYRFKKDANGRWTYESGAPVTDTMLMQKLNNGEGKPVGSPVVQNAPKYEAKVPMSNAERRQKISDLRMSPQISDQQEADKLFEIQRAQDIYYPDVSDQLILPPKNMSDLKAAEWKVNNSLGFPMERARLAGEAAAGPNDDPVDNFRHANAGRYTAEAIEDAVSNPMSHFQFLAPAVGFIGSNLSGIGHELSTLFGGMDDRDWTDKLRESGEDIYNNYVGAKVGASDMTPIEKTNYLLYLSDNNKLPDGIVGGKNKKGQTNNMYFKKSPNDPGQYKSSYDEGGYIEAELTPEEIEEYRKGGYIVEDISVPSLNQMEKGGAACPPGYIKVRGKCVKPQNMIMRNQMAPYVTNDINDPRLEAYKDSLGLHNQSLANHAEVRRNNMIPVFTNLPPNGSRRLYDRVLRNQTIKPEGYIHAERTSRTNNPSVREVIYPVYKAPVQQVVYKPKSKKKTTKPVDKKPVIVEPVIQEEKQIETIPNLQPTYIEHPLNKFIETNNPGLGTDVMPVYDTDELPMYPTPDPDAEWVGDTERYIDWDGNSIGYNLPRVRKPGHGGDLIRKGKRRYLHLPSIETRYEAEIVPEEEYAMGGEYTIGDEVELTDAEVKRLRSLGYIIEQL